MKETFCKCCECQYLGDKYSFEQPNDLIDMDEKIHGLNIITVIVAIVIITDRILQA